jgi:hypothetical protein
MDRFDVSTVDVKVVECSDFISGLKDEYRDGVVLLFDSYAYSFDGVSGGETGVGDVVIKLESSVDFVSSSFSDCGSGMYELHTDENCYVLNVYRCDVGDCCLVLFVRDYTVYPFGFGEEMQGDVDYREEVISYE